MCLLPQKNPQVFQPGLPNIYGQIYNSVGGGLFHNCSGGSTKMTGAFIAIPNGLDSSIGVDPSGGKAKGFQIDASRCSEVYGRSGTVQPLAMTVNYFIRAK